MSASDGPGGGPGGEGYLVVPDTNVVVAASIIESATGIGTVKHEFYEESIEMFGVLRDIGTVYFLPAVRRESYMVLSRAVKSTYYARWRASGASSGRYADIHNMVTSAHVRLVKLASRMVDARPDAGAVRANLRRVADMSRHLEETYRRRYSDPARRKRTALERQGPTARNPDWRRDLRDEVARTHRAQVECEALQLGRFRRGYPNASDQRILAEAAAVRDGARRGGPPVMIASLDTGFFSPYHHPLGRSDLVTEEIRARFGIVCRRPREIVIMARRGAGRRGRAGRAGRRGAARRARRKN